MLLHAAADLQQRARAHRRDTKSVMPRQGRTCCSNTSCSAGVACTSRLPKALGPSIGEPACSPCGEWAGDRLLQSLQHSCEQATCYDRLTVPAECAFVGCQRSCDQADLWLLRVADRPSSVQCFKLACRQRSAGHVVPEHGL